MRTIRISASRTYDVMIGSGLMERAGDFLKETLGPCRALVASDSNVWPLYGKALLDSLAQSGIEVAGTFVFEAGEQSKNLQSYERLTEELCERRLSRSDAVIALGGGVGGDLAGFAAATYARGMKLCMLPTSLLSMVDSSVGGKTAIDLAGGKNMLGCFYQPHLVLCDVDALYTLPEAEYENGCAEIVKYAMLGSRELFDALLAVPVKNAYEKIISTCVDMKRAFVEADERDTGERMKLNLGHTLGHAAEKLSAYQIPHGRAVAMGMAAITRAACAHGLCGRDTLKALLKALSAYKLPTQMPYSAAELAPAALGDKKTSGDMISLIVPRSVGECEILRLPKAELEAFIKAGEQA